MKVLLSSFHLNGHTLGFDPQTYKFENLIQNNKQCHMKVLLSSFYFSGHTPGFHPRTYKFENLVQNKQYHRKVLYSSFHFNGHTLVSSTLYIVQSTVCLSLLLYRFPTNSRSS